MFEFCVTFCWSTVYSHVRPCTTLYRAQTTYEISPLFVSCFAGVRGRRRLANDNVLYHLQPGLASVRDFGGDLSETAFLGNLAEGGHSAPSRLPGRNPRRAAAARQPRLYRKTFGVGRGGLTTQMTRRAVEATYTRMHISVSTDHSAWHVSSQPLRFARRH
jgi:hypothetical protein